MALSEPVYRSATSIPATSCERADVIITQLAAMSLFAPPTSTEPFNL